MTNKSKVGGTTETVRGVSNEVLPPTFGTQRKAHFVDGAHARHVNSTLGTKVYTRKKIEEVESIPLETLQDYWAAKFGFDWVRDSVAHSNILDSLICMRLFSEALLETCTTPLAFDAPAFRTVTTYRLGDIKRAHT